jgi:hypothetical protein
VVTPRQLREEAGICRALMREIKDLPSLAMFRERAEQLERCAAAFERKVGKIENPRESAVPWLRPSESATEP